MPFRHRRGTPRGCPYGAEGAGAVTGTGTDTGPQMQLNKFGSIAFNEWINLPARFSNFELDVFQIMPNHMHGIIVLNDVGAPLAGAHDAGTHHTVIHPVNRAGESPAPTGTIIGVYKSLVASACLKIFKSENKIMGKLWQRDYYEHIIRNEQSYQNISKYIINNPAKWSDDRFFELGLGGD